MTETAVTPPAAKPKTDSGYIVLLATEDGWATAGESTAKSANQAIRQWAEKATTLNGATLVAVPLRSWKPVKVSAKTTTTLVVEDA